MVIFKNSPLHAINIADVAIKKTPLAPLRSTGFQVKTSTQLFSSPAHNFKAFVN